MPLSPGIHDVQDRLACARDEHLSQIVALVDRMEIRGAADALLDPLRSRLAQLAPVRPLTIGRVLFQPLDSVIEPGARWQRNAAAVPRTALAPFGAAILSRIGACAAEVRAMIDGRSWADSAIIAAAGALLWPAAADVAGTIEVPPGWTEAGLPVSCFGIVRSNIAAVLHHAPLLARWSFETDRSELPGLIREALAETQACHPEGLTIVLAALLANSAVASSVLAAASNVPGTAPETAVKQALTRIEQDLTASMQVDGLSAACTQAIHAAALLEAVGGPTAQPRFRPLAERTRQTADEACRSRVLQAVDQQILPALMSTAAFDDDALAALGSAARNIRRLCIVGQTFGASRAYDKLLTRTAADIVGAPASALSRMDRLRLAELLVGGEAALSFSPG